LKTGVIGVGSMGQNHARVYNEISNLVGIADVNEEQGKKLSKKFRVKFYKDYEEMLEHVDAISIAVPTFLHYEIAKKAISKKVNILIEKPLSDNIQKCQKLIDLAKKGNVTLAVGHIERHNPVVAYAKKAIVDKLWGNLISMSSKRVSPYPERISDVGVILDFAVHDIDILRYLSNDKVMSVFCSGGFYKSSDREDYATLSLNFSSGVIGISEVSWLTPMKVRKIYLTCSTHYIEIDLLTQTIEILNSQLLEVNEGNLFNTTLKIQKDIINVPKKEPLMLEILDFLTCVKKKKEPLVTGQDGLMNISIAQSAIESLNNNKLIKIK